LAVISRGGKAIDWLKDWWGNDVFDVQTVIESVPGPNGIFQDGRIVTDTRSIDYTGFGGEYIPISKCSLTKFD
jgi:hypothetical protein